MRNLFAYRRTLPHFQGDHRPIFATFSTFHRWSLPGLARDIVLDACLHANGKTCELHGAVVMPDHVHLVFTPLIAEDGPVPIPLILQRIKSESAHRVNRLLGRCGHVWQDESFDHVLGHTETIAAKLEYLMGNPVAAGLVKNPLDYPWLWREFGNNAG
jgi:REP-associated tyrosine transposase